MYSNRAPYTTPPLSLLHTAFSGGGGDTTGGGGDTTVTEVNEAGQGGEQPEAGDLLVEGDEREYILELLMREVPPSQPADIPSPRVEVNTLKGKKKRNLGKKLRKKLKLAKGKGELGRGRGEAGGLQPPPQPRGQG